MKPNLLWTALHLPRLSLDLIERQRPPRELDGEPQRAVAIVTHRRIVDCDDEACAAGIRPGMTAAAAQALLPDLELVDRNLATEESALRDLAIWSFSVTSTVVIHGVDALMLELGGSARYFGGLRALLHRITAETAAQGFRVRVGSAPTPQGALLLARNGQPGAVNPKRANRLIASLPIWTLEASTPHLRILESLAIDTVGALMALPRAGVKRRFGKPMLEELDRALGEKPDPREYLQLPDRYDSRFELLGAVSNSDTLLFLSKRLLDPLAGYLTARRAGLAEYTIVFLHERERSGTAPATRLRIELLSPSDQPSHLLMLLKERLARQQLPAPTTEIRLEAHHVVQMDERPLTLWPDPRGTSDGLERLIERLSARMGAEAICRLQEVPDHRPEHASTLVPAAVKPPKSYPEEELPAPRPFWLLQEARPLRERDGAPYYEGTLRLIRGPDCIESGWWDQDAARDYFIARTEAGAAVWIFRSRPRNTSEQATWFLHGFFA